MLSLYSLGSLVLVGLFWGITNPFIRRGSKGIERIRTRSKIKNVLLELKFLLTRLDYWIPFILNQMGSVLFVLTLQHQNLSTSVPVANSLGFVFTAITGYCLGEKIPTKNVIIGSVLVCIGSILLVLDNFN